MVHAQIAATRMRTAACGLEVLPCLARLPVLLLQLLLLRDAALSAAETALLLLLLFETGMLADCHCHIHQ
jgi:hypothetical protein